MTNVAILGSCVTRDNFNSKFISDYKDYYQCVLHQNQMSMISLMAQPIGFQFEDIDNIKSFDKKQFATELDKSFFKSMMLNNPDYLIIDFYGDVRFGVIEVEDTYITNKDFVFNKTSQFNKYKSKNAISLFDNEGEYFEKWKKAVDKFMLKMKKEFPYCKVIINKARFTDKYYDLKEDTVKILSESGKNIVLDTNEYNKYLDMLDNYIIEKYNLDYFDFSAYEYLAVEDHPWGIYYVHYEKKYYEDFTEQFREKIIKDKELFVGKYTINPNLLGINLIENSTFHKGYSGWSSSNKNFEIVKGKFETESYIKIYKSGIEKDKFFQIWSNPIEVANIKNLVFTLSFEIKVEDIKKVDGEKKVFGIRTFDTYEDTMQSKAVWYEYIAIDDIENLVEGEWIKVTKSIVASKGKYLKVATLLCRNGAVAWRKIKLEVGDSETDWTPSIEDIIKPIIKNIKYDYEENHLFMEGYLNSNDRKIDINLIERNTTIDVMLQKMLKGKVTFDNLSFKVIFKLDNISTALVKGGIWDIYINIDGYQNRIICDGFVKKYIQTTKSLHDLSIYKTDKNSVALFVNEINCINLKKDILLNDNGKSIINLNINTKKDISIKSVYLEFIKKADNSISIYEANRLIEMKESKYGDYYLIIENECKFFEAKESGVWELYLKIEYSNGQSYKAKFDLSDKLKRIFEFGDNLGFYEKCLETDSQGNVNLVCRNKDTSIDIHELKWIDSGILEISFKKASFSTLSVKKIIIAPRTSKDSKLALRYLSKEFEIDRKTQQISIELNNWLNMLNLQDGNIYDLYYEIEDEATLNTTVREISNKNKMDYEYKGVGDSAYYAKPYKTQKSTVAIYVKKVVKKPSENSLKLAVLGSCYTRTAFVSTEYFNQFYKEKYKVVFTQFHSSIPSIMSEAVEFEKDYFNFLGKVNLEYVKNDMEKNFFEKLEETKPEVLIIDLYADAVRDLLINSEGKIITGNYFIKDSNYLVGNLEWEIVKTKDINRFLGIWIKAVDEFAKKVVNYIEEEKIVLNSIRLTKKYFDNTGKVQEFNEYQELIDNSNYYLEFMEKYILAKLPKTKIINVNYKNKYIGDERYPYGKSPNHYESGYYKELMSQLDSLVVQNRWLDQEESI